MPPKKKGGKKKGEEEEEEVEGYDIKTMTTDELKKYARMLERGLEEMRKHCSFYQSEGDTLSHLYQVRQEELQQKESLILSKDIEREEIRLKSMQEIQNKEQCLTYRKYSSFQHENKLKSETDAKLESLKESHQKEQDALKIELIESEKNLEADARKIHLLKMDAMLSAAKKLENLEIDEKKAIATNTERFVNFFKELKFNFDLNMESFEAKALEDRRIAEQKFRNNCILFKEHLHDYYKNITKEDLMTIKELKQKVYGLEEDIKISKSTLKFLLEGNFKLKKNSSQIFSVKKKKLGGTKIIDSKFKLAKAISEQKKMEKLRKENEVLENEIEKVENEANNLRNHFTGTLCKIRKSAELKAKILEKKIDYELNGEKIKE